MKKCMEHTWTRGRMNDLFERCRWCPETRNLGSEAPSSPVETMGADSGTPERPPTNESPHLAAKYWRERQALRDEVGQQATEIGRLNRAITRVLVLIAPETQMAQPLYGDRYFDEADIRAALEGP